MVSTGSRARELLEAGQLSAAIDEVGREVKARPAEPGLRTFLFELLCFAGSFDRAERQLDVIANGDAAADVGVQVYRNALAAERARAALFTGGALPNFFLPPPDYAALHIEALKRLRDGRASEASAILEEAEQHRPHPSGRRGEDCFGDFKDADDVLGPFLEVIVHDKYFWLPIEQIEHIEISRPVRLRDLMWIPAKVACWDVPVGGVLLPVLYFGSSEHSDERVRLGRMTDWSAVGEGPVRGVGQRLFLVDDRDEPLLEIRDVLFERGAGDD